MTQYKNLYIYYTLDNIIINEANKISIINVNRNKNKCTNVKTTSLLNIYIQIISTYSYLSKNY